MLQITDIPTEQTTAATDVLLSILAFIISLRVFQSGKSIDLNKTRIWIWVFGLVTLASAIGAIAHGLKMSSLTNFELWLPLKLSLGVAIGLFAAGALYDFRNFRLPEAFMPLLLVCVIIFFVITVLLPVAFIVLIIYDAIVMLFAFAVYTILAFRRTFKGAGLMAAGVFVTIAAAVIQPVKAISITLIWKLDHNGISHIVQMIGMIILLIGLQTEFRSRAKS
jgi:hypothetical protein